MFFAKYNAQLLNKMRKTKFKNLCFKLHNLNFTFQIVLNIIIVQLLKFGNFTF